MSEEHKHEREHGEDREHDHKREVRIHIDQHRYESPNPTTGTALYALGKVAEGLELYREVDGNREDTPIDNGPETIHLREDDHFHSGPPKTYTIIVNGRPRTVSEKHISFLKVVGLAFDPIPTGPDLIFTITYWNGPQPNPEGTLLEGSTVKIKEGMVFNVTPTDKS